MQGHAAQSGQLMRHAFTPVFMVLVLGLRLFPTRQARRLLEEARAARA